MTMQMNRPGSGTTLFGIAALVSAMSIGLAAQAPDRSKPPVPGPAPTLKPPAVQKQQLSNGIPVWLVEQHEVPVVQVNLVVASGSADDPAGKFGTANLMASMLMEGAGSRSSLELADAIDFLGADISATNTSDSAAVLAWAKRWHALGKLSFGSEYNDALQGVTELSAAPRRRAARRIRCKRGRRYRLSSGAAAVPWSWVRTLTRTSFR